MDPMYDECGEFCGDKQESCIGYCDGCPMVQMQKQFEVECKERLEQRVPDKCDELDFDHLLQTVLDLSRIEILPPSYISAFYGRLISAKNQELMRWKRLEAWNKKTDNTAED